MILVPLLLFSVGQVFSAQAAKGTPSFARTSPTMLLILENEGVPKNQIIALQERNDFLITTFIYSIDVSTTFYRVNEGQVDMNIINTAYRHKLMVCVQDNIDQQFKSLYELIVNIGTSYVSYLIWLSILKGEESWQAAVERAVMPKKIMEKVKSIQTRAALKVTEWNVQLAVVGMLRTAAAKTTACFEDINSLFNSVIDLTITNVRKCFTRQGESVEVVTEAMLWAQQIYNQEMAILTASFLLPTTKGIQIHMVPLWNAHNRQSLIEATMKPMNMGQVPVAFLSFVEAAHQLLSADLFRSFVVKVMGEGLVDDHLVREDKHGTQQLLRQIDCQAKQVCLGKNAEETEVVVELSKLYKMWLKAWLLGRVIGFTDYLSAFARMPSVLEFANCHKNVALMDTLIGWAAAYEEFVERFDHLMVKRSLQLDMWRPHAKAIKQMPILLSQVLHSCKDYQPLPLTINISRYSKSNFLANVNSIFALSPIVKEFVQHLLNTMTGIEERYQIVFYMSRLQVSIIRFQAQLFGNSDAKVKKRFWADLQDFFNSQLDHQPLLPSAATGQLPLYLQCLIAREEYRYALWDRDILVHFHNLPEDDSAITILSYFKRHLAEAKLIYGVVMKDRNNLRSESAGIKYENNLKLEIAVDKLRVLLVKECRLAKMIMLISPKLLYVVQCTFETLRVCKLLLNQQS